MFFVILQCKIVKLNIIIINDVLNKRNKSVIRMYDKGFNPIYYKVTNILS